MEKLIGIFEGIPIEGLESEIKDKEAKPYTNFPEQDLLRILQEGCIKIRKDYGSSVDQYMVKDYKTKTKWMLFIRRNEEESLYGYIYAYYDINYCPYYNETSEFYNSTDSVKKIERKLKKATDSDHEYFHFDYDDSLFKDMFERGMFYSSYRIINLKKRR